MSPLRATLPSALVAFALAAQVAGCSKGAGRGGSGVGQACAADGDCARGLTCASGTCALPPGAAVCTPNARLCDGSNVVVCDATGQGTTQAQSCPSGCANGACIDPACVLGARRCGADGIEQCSADPAGVQSWQLFQACLAGCDPTTLTCNALACRPLDVRCSPTAPNTPQTCDGDGSGWTDDTPCAAGTTCSQGTCLAQACAPGAISCNGNNLVTCDAQGSGYTNSTACPHGCAAGACLDGLCTPGASACTASGAVQVCNPDGNGFTQTESCGESSCVVLSADQAACAVPVCTPLSRRCGADGTSVQVCLADGSGWSAPDECDPGATCSDGLCGAPPLACIAGALRCDGAEVQECEKSAWTTIGACFGGCTAGGVCSGGSCGAQVPVTVALPACAGSTCPPPADGVSTLLAVAGPLLDSAGATLPDGTLVTVAAAGASSIVSGDADPTTPGVQVRTVSGYADFSFTAPPSASQVVVSAQIGNSVACAGTATVDFAAPGGWLYVAEDFTTSTLRDLANSTADWRTDLGVAQSTSYPFGTGSDGPLDVSSLGANGTWDLAQTPRGAGLPPFAPSLQVVGLGAQAAQVQGSVAGFSAGDEVLLIELQGASLASNSSAGSWEFLTLASVADGALTFTSPVLGTYAAAPGQALAGEKVAIQRIPQFTTVNVPAGSTLTASAWDGTQGGIVAFRANGTVTAAGAISADAIGYRAGASTSPTLNQPGESYGGQPAPSAVASVRNEGAGGGGYLLCDPAHLDQLDTWYGAGGSYGTSGVAGSSVPIPAAAVGRAACAPAQGLPYGTPTLSKLFPGSGSGSQQFNSSGPCNTNTCPGESRGPGYVQSNPAVLDYPAAFQTASPQCGTSGQPACPVTFNFCTAETASYTTAYQTVGASSCNTTLNPNCAATFAACGTQAATYNGSTLTLAHAPFNYAGDNVCNTAACNDTRSYCGADTSSWSSAIEQTGVGCTTTACTNTFANCSAYSLSYSSATKANNASCTTQSCINTLNACSSYTANYAAEAYPCNSANNPACQNTFNACSAYDVSHSDSPYPSASDCSSSCPGLVESASDCYHCGCARADPYDCAYPSCSSAAGGCDYVCQGGNCGNTGATGTFSGCGNKNNSCATEGNCGSYQWCDSDCNIIGDNCNCHYECLVCWGYAAYSAGDSRCNNLNCNTCSVCSGCVTNPGCQTNPGCGTNPGCSINPGCDTNVGCKTNTGCDTCGGRNSWDGTFCDFTNPHNSCACPDPWEAETQGGRGGGILFVAAQSLDLSGGGRVSARGGAPGVNGSGGFAGGAGGSLWVRVGTLELASSGGGANPNLLHPDATSLLQIDASGAANAGAGRVRIERAGGDDPVALNAVSPAPYTPAFSLQQVQSISLLPTGFAKQATSAELIPFADPALTALIEGAAPLVLQEIYAPQSGGGSSFIPLAPGATDSFLAATGDVRFRVVFSPRPGPIARSAGLAWIFQVQ